MKLSVRVVIEKTAIKIFPSKRNVHCVEISDMFCGLPNTEKTSALAVIKNANMQTHQHTKNVLGVMMLDQCEEESSPKKKSATNAT